MNPMPMLIVGLGNPGPAYAGTRHNIGWTIVAGLADTHGIALNQHRWAAQFGTGTIGDRPVIAAIPTAFMNRSGPPVRALADAHAISPDRILVIHDDTDLALGRLKIKSKGGDGGHRGLRSIQDALQSTTFGRLRIGIGRPAVGDDMVAHVLGKFTTDESALVDGIVARALEAVATIICQGIPVGMNRFNGMPAINVNPDSA